MPRVTFNQRLNSGLVQMNGTVWVSANLRDRRGTVECLYCDRTMATGETAWRTLSESVAQTGGILRFERMCDTCVRRLELALPEVR